MWTDLSSILPQCTCLIDGQTDVVIKLRISCKIKFTDESNCLTIYRYCVHLVVILYILRDKKCRGKINIFLVHFSVSRGLNKSTLCKFWPMLTTNDP